MTIVITLAVWGLLDVGLSNIENKDVFHELLLPNNKVMVLYLTNNSQWTIAPRVRQTYKNILRGRHCLAREDACPLS